MTGADRAVVDASALGAIAFGEAEAEDIARRLRGARLLAPRLIRYELASICVHKAAREPEKRALLLASLRRTSLAAITEMPVEPATLAGLAMEHDLSAYDAAYLHLALVGGCRLVTLDRKLGAVWRSIVG